MKRIYKYIHEFLKIYVFKNSKYISYSHFKTIENIEHKTSKYFGIKQEVLKLNVRHSDIVKCRQIVMAVSNILCKLSLNKVSELTYKKHYSTIIYSKTNIKNRIDTDKGYKEDFINICNLLNIDFDYVYGRL